MAQDPKRIRRRGARDRGTAMLELALLSPWVFFLFIGILDWGFYATALISTQAAARSAALYTSTSAGTAADNATACTIALGELHRLPNMWNVTAPCSSNPVVTAARITGPDGVANGATRVTVQYDTVRLIALPRLLPSRIRITRTVVMRLRSMSAT